MRDPDRRTRMGEERDVAGLRRLLDSTGSEAGDVVIEEITTDMNLIGYRNEGHERVNRRHLI
jgi:hypothetical protein